MDVSLYARDRSPHGFPDFFTSSMASLMVDARPLRMLSISSPIFMGSMYSFPRYPAYLPLISRFFCSSSITSQYRVNLLQLDHHAPDRLSFRHSFGYGFLLIIKLSFCLILNSSYSLLSSLYSCSSRCLSKAIHLQLFNRPLMVSQQFFVLLLKLNGLSVLVQVHPATAS